MDVWARSNARPGYTSNKYRKSPDTIHFYLFSSFIRIWFGFLQVTFVSTRYVLEGPKCLGIVTLAPSLMQR